MFYDVSDDHSMIFFFFVDIRTAFALKLIWYIKGVEICAWIMLIFPILFFLLSYFLSWVNTVANLQM